jgi:hypothetical protein
VPGKIGAGNRLTFADDIERNTSIDVARRRASGNTKICGIYFPHSQEAYCSAREQYAWIKYLSSVFLFARTFFLPRSTIGQNFFRGLLVPFKMIW